MTARRTELNKVLQRIINRKWTDLSLSPSAREAEKNKERQNDENRDVQKDDMNGKQTITQKKQPECGYMNMPQSMGNENALKRTLDSSDGHSNGNNKRIKLSFWEQLTETQRAAVNARMLFDAVLDHDLSGADSIEAPTQIDHPNQRVNPGGNTLFDAVLNHDLSGAKRLIEQGADVNEIVASDSNVLTECIKGWKAGDNSSILIGMVRLLVTKRADVTTRDYAGNTILHHAARVGEDDTTNNSLMRVLRAEIKDRSFGALVNDEGKEADAIAWLQGFPESCKKMYMWQQGWG